MQKVLIREMNIDDYPKLTNFSLSEELTLEKVDSILKRNPGCSFVAEIDGKPVGIVMCGHDGYRGYLHSMRVDKNYRRNNIGKSLAQACINALKLAGIRKCNIHVVKDNETGLAFWQNIGWFKRPDLEHLQILTSSEKDKR